MNVGDYVRTKCGIAKIVGTEAQDLIINLDKAIMYNHVNYIASCTLDEIIKSSPQIIDLIEVGDYVNGRKVSKINLDKTLNKEKCILCADTNYDCLDTVYKNEDIKSIVTHEQMEAMQYRVEE